MKRIILLLTLIPVLFIALFTTSNKVYADTSVVDEIISFRVKKDTGYGIDNHINYETDNYQVGMLLENYYDHQFRLGIEQINVELKINNNELLYPGFYSITDDAINLFYVYEEFGTLNDAQIIFKYNSKQLVIVGGPIGYNFEGIWEMVIPKVVYHDLEELPETQGAEIGFVEFVINDTKLVIDIDYAGNNYQLIRHFIEKTDMSIFETVEAYYMNVGGNKPQIIINHSDKKYLADILVSADGEAPVFVPHTVWDLSTNDLITKDKYATNIYVDVNKAGVMIAYVYVDEFIIDDIVSTTISWTSRTKTERLWGWFNGAFNSYSEWENYQATFKNDEYVKYKDRTFDWQNKIPQWNIFRGIYQNIKTFKMPRISAVNLDNPGKDYNVTRELIEKYFNEVNPDFEQLKENPRYKLWAFALEPNAINEVDLLWGTVFGSAVNKYTQFYQNEEDKTDPDNLHIINIDYITNGKAYVADGNDMNFYIKVNPILTPKPGEEDNPKWGLIILIIIIVLYVYIIFKFKANTLKKLGEVTIIYVIMLVLIYMAYIFILPELNILTVLLL